MSTNEKFKNKMAKLKQISVRGEKFYFRLSFDIDDFIGDGIWWLEIYHSNRNLMYDKPFASSINILDEKKARRIIVEDFLTLKGELI